MALFLLLHFLALKGSTKGIASAFCTGRANVDLFGGAIAFTVVIHAVLNVAANALDMVAAATASLFGHDGFFLIYDSSGLDRMYPTVPQNYFSPTICFLYRQLFHERR